MSYAKYNSAKYKRRWKKRSPKDVDLELSAAHKRLRDKERKQLKMDNRKEINTLLGTAIEVMLARWYEFFQLCMNLRKE